MLSQVQALERAREFVAALGRGGRAEGGYQDGAVVDLHGFAGAVYLIGDVHAKRSRIPAIFAHAELRPQLEAGQAVVVFLGDLFHREESHLAQEMNSSLETLFDVIEWKVAFPRGVYVLLGNHEFTRTGRSKQGVSQGALFRATMESLYPQRDADGLALADYYERFIQSSPLVAFHPRFAASHAAPALSVSTLEDLKALRAQDVEAHLLHPAVRELTHFRYVDHDLTGRSSYNDYHVKDFLQLCGVGQEGVLFHGHSPLNRETGWHWPMAPRNRVIFAAGREVGYARADSEGLRLIRLGRTLRDNDDELVLDRAGGVDLDFADGFARVGAPVGGEELIPDLLYAFTYGGRPVTIGLGSMGALTLLHHRDLPHWRRVSCTPGFYLAGPQGWREVVKLKRYDTILIGDESSEQALTFNMEGLASLEACLLSQLEEGSFEIRALIPGISLGEGA